ncbi:MAG TPA: hypothetical protein VHA52_00455, partial [Candidatus Babeliaceae bacterium]|nr:hypothetical protein [Candidatus Babeliaceae bacterium]
MFCTIIAISLGGCATPYQEFQTFGGIPLGGYADAQVNQNTAIVTFRANIFSPFNRIRSFLIYRSAQVTLENGYDYFIVVSMTTSPVNVNLQTQYDYHGYNTDPPRLYTS